MMRVSLYKHGFTIALVAIALLAQAGHARSNPRSLPNGSGGEDNPPFVAQHIEKKATITLHGDIETVWPLFDPVNESKWAPVWKPEIIHPRNRVVQEGMVFRTHGGTVWIVSRYESKNRHITYTVNHPERVCTIDVQCSKHGESNTDATITYNFVGLTPHGNELIEASSNRLFASDLKDWQKAINYYLKTGEALPHVQHGEHGEGH